MRGQLPPADAARDGRNKLAADANFKFANLNDEIREIERSEATNFNILFYFLRSTKQFNSFILPPRRRRPPGATTAATAAAATATTMAGDVSDRPVVAPGSILCGPLCRPTSPSRRLLPHPPPRPPPSGSGQLLSSTPTRPAQQLARSPSGAPLAGRATAGRRLHAIELPRLLPFHGRGSQRQPVRRFRRLLPTRRPADKKLRLAARQHYLIRRVASDELAAAATSV